MNLIQKEFDIIQIKGFTEKWMISNAILFKQKLNTIFKMWKILQNLNYIWMLSICKSPGVVFKKTQVSINNPQRWRINLYNAKILFGVWRFKYEPNRNLFDRKECTLPQIWPTMIKRKHGKPPERKQNGASQGREYILLLSGES